MNKYIEDSKPWVLWKEKKIEEIRDFLAVLCEGIRIVALYIYPIMPKTSESICRQLGVSANTYYRWRKEYGGLEIDQARRLRQLEKENTRLKKLVAEQALDIEILKEASRGNF